MNAYRKKTVGAVLAALLLAGGATACEDGKNAKKDNGGSASAPASPSPSASAKQPAGVTPAAYLEKTKKKSEEITSLRYTISGKAAGESITGEAAMRIKPTVAMSMTMESPEKPGEKVQIRLVDGAMYMGAEGKWLKFDLKALAPEQAKELDSLGSAQQGQNPADTADSLSASKDLKTVGEETVDGQKTTHLAGTVTLDEMRARSAASTPEAKERQEKNIKALEEQGIKSLTMDIWIDEADQVKQVRTQGQGTTGPMDVTIKFLDVNKPVDVAAPPADQVMDLGEMMKGSGGAGSA
ncbi:MULTISPECIES: LppX_LprAFG lipoprotein [unclassified Streptomyces]|uniref:LppX_LprAFG lipoprotein n=1 Tax=unclassified Streptomyces TaxID=2593676 RepID=UPI002259BF73|nr:MULTISPECIES: LppX_LprAFG lipoprotein [unclassified Streptomyces]MCX4527519.1 LppX_LprAFG lipoprotein [Streptomyces sp. NBC_01551]MCX4541883.1 LppX_LprAFG lipoprotein [Streptomyces sp. NBC_01565]